MRPAAISVISLLLLLLLVTTAQGIRLDEESLAAFRKKIHEKGSLMGGGSGAARVIVCRDDGHCSGRSRKLVTQTMSTSKRERSEEGTQHSREGIDRNREDHHGKPPISGHRKFSPGTYPDSLGIEEMDYSPAKRKPPIHNYILRHN